MLLMLKMNPAAYGCNLKGFATAPKCTICRSDVVCLLPGIHSNVRLPKLDDYQI